MFGIATGTGSRGWLVDPWLPRVGPPSCALQASVCPGFRSVGERVLSKSILERVGTYRGTL